MTDTMTNELEPLKECPFCGGKFEVFHDGFGFTYRHVDHIRSLIKHCPITVSICSKEADMVRLLNTRYKRTCHKVPGKMGYQGRKVICSECGYGLGDDRWSFCPKCGAEICGAEVIDVDS